MGDDMMQVWAVPKVRCGAYLLALGEHIVALMIWREIVESRARARTLGIFLCRF